MGRVGRWFWILALGIIGGSGGCASEEESPVVAEAQGWQLRLSDVVSEYERLHGPGTFARAEPRWRESFLRTLANKELLLREARRAIPRLSPESERRVRVEGENRLHGAYQQRIKQTWQPDSSRWNANLAKLSQEARALRILMRRPSAGDSCYRALQNGLSFTDAFRRFDVKGMEPARMDLGWHDPLWFPPRVTRDLFLEGLEAGKYTAPIRTTRGVWITQVLEYRPLDLNARRSQQGRLEDLLRRMMFRDDASTRSDSLKQAAGLAFHPENFEPIGRVVTAYFDSIRTERPLRGRQDQWILRAPVWRLAPEELSRPVYELRGKTGTVPEYLRTLDTADLEYWPHRTHPASLKRSVEQRIERLMVVQEAQRLGLDQAEEYREALHRIADEALLEQYNEHVLTVEVEATPAETESLFDADPGRWKVPERIQFSAVIFPAGGEEQAADFHEKVKSAGTTDWALAAEAEVDSSEEVRYIRETGVLDVGSLPEPRDWAPLLRAAEKLEIGQVGTPIQGSEGSAVVRCTYRLPARPIPRAVALPLAEREVRLLKVEAKVTEILKRAEEREQMRTYPDRLHTLTRGTQK